MKIIDLFAGIGGFSLAAHWAGWETILFCEINEKRHPDLKRNFPGVPIHADVTTLTKNKIYEYCGKFRANDIILTGGFPCQDISIAGKGEGIEGERSGLWSEFYRLTKEIRPAGILAENSPEITKKGFEKILCDLAEIGYNVEWESFFASEFGHYHKRERTYFFAYPNSQRRPGTLHYVKRSLKEAGKEKYPLDSQSHPILEYGKSNSQPVLFGMDDGVSRRMVVDALEAYGNSIVPRIPYEIFKVF